MRTNVCAPVLQDSTRTVNCYTSSEIPKKNLMLPVLGLSVHRIRPFSSWYRYDRHQIVFESHHVLHPDIPDNCSYCRYGGLSIHHYLSGSCHCLSVNCLLHYLHHCIVLCKCIRT